ncbi:MAG: hypothetical protein SAJ12_08990 [Jaaginema sp. PMC 1079.18]|nr:hypothetical protein [Jaaginema sp. PMC 1080.18]MEC4851136.1 hypothetical protein [Jaaginema sp. PMC 1079.18]
MNLNDEDVIHISKHTPPSVGKTFKVEELLNWLYNQLEYCDQDIVKGIDAQILSTTQPGGWKTGTIKLTVEFTETPPDDDPPPE